jgi:clan AA aspartic protease
VIGIVDEHNRALLEIAASGKLSGPYVPTTAWIDTAFDGHLVFSESLIESLDLETLAETEAILADGSKVVLETFLCYVDWFRQQVPLQVIANEGKFPLLGTGLLQHRVLHIDYAQKSLTLD